MSKSAVTQQLESFIKHHFAFRQGNIVAYEVQFGFNVKEPEYVDAALYELGRDQLTCFEIKSTVSDFHSKAKKTFVGHKNYYVMPMELFEKVKDEIPDDIGVYCMDERWGLNTLLCAKRCVVREEADYDQVTILKSMLRSINNWSNRQVEKNSFKVDDVIMRHLEIVDMDDLEGYRIKLKDMKYIDKPCIQLFVSKVDEPDDFETLLNVIKGGCCPNV